MDYYISYYAKKDNTASAKAPSDVLEICRRRGMKEIKIPAFSDDKYTFKDKLIKALAAACWWIRIFFILKSGDSLFMQHPMYGKKISYKFIPWIRKHKKCKFIVLIHDLESLRGGIEGQFENMEAANDFADNVFLKCFDRVICHNSKMRDYMASKGFEKEKLVSLEIFDYLSAREAKNSAKHTDPTLVIAGNLAPGKCGYAYKMAKASSEFLKLELYGNYYDDNYHAEGVTYHGSFEPDELANHIDADFGLIWDGNSVDSCIGNTGNYLRYNNPHKASFYLSAGIPVIIWKEAALADFVKKNNVGICVENLVGLDKVIEEISDEEYSEMKKNTVELSKKLRNGYFLNRALDHCSQ